MAGDSGSAKLFPATEKSLENSDQTSLLGGMMLHGGQYNKMSKQSLRGAYHREKLGPFLL